MSDHEVEAQMLALELEAEHEECLRLEKKAYEDHQAGSGPDGASCPVRRPETSGEQLSSNGEDGVGGWLGGKLS